MVDSSWLDLTLLMAAVLVWRRRRTSDSAILAGFWAASMVLFPLCSESVLWFAAYSGLCALSCVVGSAFLIGLFLLQILICGGVVAEWYSGDLIYGAYSWLIGSCFALQVLGVAIGRIDCSRFDFNFSRLRHAQTHKG
jgi:hypothetical protein